MRKIFVLILLIFFAKAQAGPEVKPVDKQIMQHLFNAEFGKADSLLSLQIKANPNHPKYYCLKAPVCFYARYFTRGLPGDSMWQLVADYSQKAIDIGEEMEKNTEVKFWLGTANGFLARVFGRRGEYWDAYWAADDCYDYLEEVIEEDPTFFDAYIGLGVIEYFNDVQLQGFWRAVAWVTGMSGNRQRGLDYFQKTADKGEFFKDEANFILATMYRFLEQDPQKAYDYLVKLGNKFPNNRFIATQKEQTYFTRLIDEKGVDFLETEFDSLQTRHHITNSFILNGIGYRFMGQERYADALRVFKTNLKLFPDVANCYDSLAECFMAQGENEQAIKYFKMAYEKIPQDSTANEAFKQRLKEGIENNLQKLGVEFPT